MVEEQVQKEMAKRIKLTEKPGTELNQANLQNKLKSPSDTTLYVPAVRRAENEALTHLSGSQILIMVNLTMITARM